MKYLLKLTLIITCTLLFISNARADTSQNSTYKVGINDVLDVKVIDHDNLRTVATVASDGSITFPFIGTVNVLNKDIVSIEAEITKRLTEGYIKFPVVTVALAKSMSRKIYTFGEFRRQGEFPFNDNMTVMEALSLAGGISLDGIFGKLIIRRKTVDSYKNEIIVEADLDNGLINNHEIENMLMEPNDILTVERNKTFLIQGEVKNRGRFVLEKNMTVLRALLQAGGVVNDGMHGKIKIRRKLEGTIGEYEDLAVANINYGIIESKDVEDIILQPDDVMMLERNDTFLIQGEVKNLGRLVLEKDMTVLKALLQAGGVTANGLHGKIKIRRKQEGVAGGYKDLVEARINSGEIESNEVEDLILQPNDILIVKKNDTFMIYGEAVRIGEFVLEDKMTVFKALTIAGGLTKWGSGNRVEILRPNNNNNGLDVIKVNIVDVIDGDASADILIMPGDTIVVSAGMF